MLAPDIGSVVTSVKGPNMVYHSKENVSRKDKLKESSLYESYIY